MVYGRRPIFDTVPEFLEWYSSWYEHLDLDEMRKDLELEFDIDESECDDVDFVRNSPPTSSCAKT